MVQPGCAAHERSLGMELADLRDHGLEFGRASLDRLSTKCQAVRGVAEMDPDRALLRPVVVLEAPTAEIPLRPLPYVVGGVGAAGNCVSKLTPPWMVLVELPPGRRRARVVIERDLVEGRESPIGLLS